MSHVASTQGNWVESWLLVVGNQIANLTSNLSFGHNLCYRCPNGQCKPMLDIYTLISFQWYKELFKAMGFDPWNCALKIQESIGTPTPNMGIHLRVWGFIPSHSLALSGACDVTFRSFSWPATLQPFAFGHELKVRVAAIIILLVLRVGMFKMKPTCHKLGDYLNFKCKLFHFMMDFFVFQVRFFNFYLFILYHIWWNHVYLK
jgi:hypothetical protein